MELPVDPQKLFHATQEQRTANIYKSSFVGGDAHLFSDDLHETELYGAQLPTEARAGVPTEARAKTQDVDRSVAHENVSRESAAPEKARSVAPEEAESAAPEEAKSAAPEKAESVVSKAESSFSSLSSLSTSKVLLHGVPLDDSFDVFDAQKVKDLILNGVVKVGGETMPMHTFAEQHGFDVAELLCKI